MLHTEQEYKKTLHKMKEFEEHMRQVQQQLQDEGYNTEEVERAVGPLRNLYDDMKWEVDLYERCQKGNFQGIQHDFGKMLIAYRIYRGWSQAELARRLNVSRAQISKDESNEYHGISYVKAQRIMQVLGVQLHSYLDPNGPQEDPSDESPSTFVGHGDFVIN
ncbi:helix-turn-helix domain-containing protein [Desmospora profundinema]|uniref:Ribosome-binding protein aMBF1 (Putative translation factor) n=1 Tax=Desmospora profundinema TaxID=1571184 RepID=A0ABU1ITD9_9BACL|nr:helix-turn-helix transcriptional regulator [Desmospora profundinema]MDR6227035.1 ribosome-binding protein aMBF1 (putative translation factor) [Desmospora profundinema]